jgi:hypothetical protein
MSPPGTRAAPGHATNMPIHRRETGRSRPGARRCTAHAQSATPATPCVNSRSTPPDVAQAAVPGLNEKTSRNGRSARRHPSAKRSHQPPPIRGGISSPGMERAVLVVEIVPHLRIMAWLVLHRRRAFRASLIAGTCGVPGFPGPGCPKAYTLDLRQFTGWCRAGRCRCSPSAAPGSRRLPGNWKDSGGPVPPSPDGCAPSPGQPGRRWSGDWPHRTYLELRARSC